MNTPVTIITTGRVTADLELKTSQNGRNTKFVQFSLAVNKGYGENNRPKPSHCEQSRKKPTATKMDSISAMWRRP